MRIRVRSGESVVGDLFLGYDGSLASEVEQLDWLVEAGAAAFHTGPDPWRPVLAAVELEADVAGFTVETQGALATVDVPEGAVS